MLIYSEHDSPRLRYIAAFAGSQCMGEPFSITHDADEYRRSAFPKINYSSNSLQEGELRIPPHGLLFEQGIKPRPVQCTERNGLKIFFQDQSVLGFDVFAASFYLLSRYEEYLPYQQDEYGRYGHENSLAFKNGFLDQPLVNKWMALLRQQLGWKDPHHFEFLPTYDIDEAWSYKNKTGFRNFGGMLRDLLKGDLDRVNMRRRVRAGRQQDPYDSFEWMDALHEKYKLKPLYFFLVAEQNGRYDKNILPSEPAMQQLISKTCSRYDTGMHPSWASGDKAGLLEREKELLESITGNGVNISRQHFLRFKLPKGYRRLIDAGITGEYSMGYATINGFRASVASSFYWYDLEKDEATDLLVHPFCFMDANSFFEQKYTPEQAGHELGHYLDQVRKVNGRLITLWHNTFLGTEKRFRGWREVYEGFVERCTFDK